MIMRMCDGGGSTAFTHISLKRNSLNFSHGSAHADGLKGSLTSPRLSCPRCHTCSQWLFAGRCSEPQQLETIARPDGPHCDQCEIQISWNFMLNNDDKVGKRLQLSCCSCCCLLPASLSPEIEADPTFTVWRRFQKLLQETADCKIGSEIK